jgi:hypothetical protein
MYFDPIFPLRKETALLNDSRLVKQKEDMKEEAEYQSTRVNAPRGP